ncbi:adapter protein CIKS [Cynoglossus semilaevis]|uniref:E3 ubiquitin ligase TRAF3IP2 n=1 Tax=Cynoglossus semilaevis TaxID=244447 RepID=A0A3P8WQV1_CYNSE|nr:adapter protein CIKS [Cynoglossus semilaevis]
MESFQGPCRHQSVPVEMDESMTPSSLDLLWPPVCNQCSRSAESSKMSNTEEKIAEKRTLPKTCYQQSSRIASQAFLNHRFATQVQPEQMNATHQRQQMPVNDRQYMPNNSRGVAGPSDWFNDCSTEDAHHLEAPLPLQSVNNPSLYPLAHLPNQYYYCPERDFPVHPHHQQFRSVSKQKPHNKNAPNAVQNYVPLQETLPPSDVMQEVSVNFSPQAGLGQNIREIRKTISLPEECRNVFITYSVDTAQDIILFTKFLTDQGFKPAIDIFDNPIRRMGITKWMDRYLNDKSVLIIVAISPQYKEDVEGNGNDDHGLHTKYIYNQIQNEFIQQGCLNFRLVPVVFPNATKRHVPNWLQSTRIYRWPQDTQDLLLRLYREERYIIPHREADLTLTVRPL